MTQPGHGSPPATLPSPLATFAGALWKGANSPIAIAVVTSIAALLLTQWYQGRQAQSADLEKRRSDLERLVVELELRKDRLWVVCNQYLTGQQDPKLYDQQQLSDLGQRAKAIVAGRSNTVTSDPAYQNFHLSTLLSQAEMTAGLSPTLQSDLMSFTDLKDMDALAGTKGIFDEIRDPIETLESELSNGEIPISVTEHQSRYTVASVASTLDRIVATDGGLKKLNCDDSGLAKVAAMASQGGGAR